MNGKKGLIIAIVILILIIIGLSVALAVVLINQNNDKDTKKSETSTVVTPTPDSTPSVKPTSKNNSWFDDDDITPSPKTTSSPTNTKTSSNRVGTYKLISLSYAGQTVSVDSNPEFASAGITLTLKNDKTGTIRSQVGSDFNEDFTWNDSYLISDEGDKMPYTYVDGKITINADTTTMVFEKN